MPAGARARLGDARLRPGRTPRAFSFQADGNAVLLVDPDHSVGCWETATGKRLWRHDPPRTGATACAVSPDGPAVAWGFADGEVRVLDTRPGRERTLRGHQEEVHALAFADGGKLLVSTSGDRTARVWDVAAGKQRGKIIEGVPPGNSRLLAVSADGKSLATDSPEGELLLWDVASGKRRHESRNASLSSMTFSPDGRVLACMDHWAKEGMGVVLYDGASGRVLNSLGGHPGSLYGLAFSPDSKSLALATVRGTVRQFRVDTGAELRTLRFRCHLDRVLAVAYSPDGKVLATADEWCVRLWDRAKCEELLPTGGHQGRVRSLAVSRDGKVVATASEDHTAGVWDLATGGERLRVSHWGPVYDVRLLPDSTALATASYDGTTRVWDAAGGKERFRLRDRMPTTPIAFAPGGAVLASADLRGRVCLWDGASGAKRASLEGEPAEVRALEFSLDGRVLACGTDGGEIRVWEVASGRPRWQIRAHPAQVATLSFSADGRLLASGGYRYLTPAGQMTTEARLWEIYSGRQVRAFADAGEFVALSPGGELLATNDRTVVVLREAATGRELGRLRGHNGSVGCGAFTANGRLLVTGSDDTTALVWDVSAFLPRARRPALGVGPVRPLGRDETERLWAKLASEDAAAAYRAVVALVSAPDAAVTGLGGRLRPVVGVDAARVARLVADLDDERFAVREQATRELKALGEVAEGALRQAVEKPVSVEARRRAELLLEPLKAPTSVETLRMLRAIEVLERIGTDRARELLRRLAGGAPEARLTREAKAALGRLTQGRSVSR